MERLADVSCRSGAVEQLRVHVRNLSMLGIDGAADSKGRVELYERGYGKDAASIAKEAIAYGEFHQFSSFIEPLHISLQLVIMISMSCLSTLLVECRTMRYAIQPA